MSFRVVTLLYSSVTIHLCTVSSINHFRKSIVSALLWSKWSERSLMEFIEIHWHSCNEVLIARMCIMETWSRWILLDVTFVVLHTTLSPTPRCLELPCSHSFVIASIQWSVSYKDPWIKFCIQYDFLVLVQVCSKHCIGNLYGYWCRNFYCDFYERSYQSLPLNIIFVIAPFARCHSQFVK